MYLLFIILFCFNLVVVLVDVSSRLVPSFTENGYLISQVPKQTFEKLKRAVDQQLLNWDNLQIEAYGDGIYHPADLPPKFVQIGSVAAEVLFELQGIHETWAGGIALRPTSAYGVRMYQNGSSLCMHNDKVC
jgi:hypothetical protein